MPRVGRSPGLRLHPPADVRTTPQRSRRRLKEPQGSRSSFRQSLNDASGTADIGTMPSQQEAALARRPIGSNGCQIFGATRRPTSLARSLVQSLPFFRRCAFNRSSLLLCRADMKEPWRCITWTRSLVMSLDLVSRRSGLAVPPDGLLPCHQVLAARIPALAGACKILEEVEKRIRIPTDTTFSLNELLGGMPCSE